MRRLQAQPSKRACGNAREEGDEEGGADLRLGGLGGRWPTKSQRGLKLDEDDEYSGNGVLRSHKTDAVTSWSCSRACTASCLQTLLRTWKIARAWSHNGDHGNLST